MHVVKAASSTTGPEHHDRVSPSMGFETGCMTPRPRRQRMPAVAAPCCWTPFRSRGYDPHPKHYLFFVSTRSHPNISPQASCSTTGAWTIESPESAFGEVPRVHVAEVFATVSWRQPFQIQAMLALPDVLDLDAIYIIGLDDAVHVVRTLRHVLCTPQPAPHVPCAPRLVSGCHRLDTTYGPWLRAGGHPSRHPSRAPGRSRSTAHSNMLPASPDGRVVEMLRAQRQLFLGKVFPGQWV